MGKTSVKPRFFLGASRQIESQSAESGGTRFSHSPRFWQVVHICLECSFLQDFSTHAARRVWICSFLCDFSTHRPQISSGILISVNFSTRRQKSRLKLQSVPIFRLNAQPKPEISSIEYGIPIRFSLRSSYSQCFVHNFSTSQNFEAVQQENQHNTIWNEFLNIYRLNSYKKLYFSTL